MAPPSNASMVASLRVPAMTRNKTVNKNNNPQPQTISLALHRHQGWHSSPLRPRRDSLGLARFCGAGSSSEDVGDLMTKSSGRIDKITATTSCPRHLRSPVFDTGFRRVGSFANKKSDPQCVSRDSRGKSEISRSCFPVRSSAIYADWIRCLICCWQVFACNPLLVMEHRGNGLPWARDQIQI